MLGGALTKRDRVGAGGGRDSSICARKVLLLKGDKSDGWGNKTSLYITCLILFIILEYLMWYVTQSLGVVNNVLKLHNLLYIDQNIEYFNR